MTNVRVLKNNDKLTIEGAKVKSVIVKHLEGNFPEINEITTIFMDKVETQHKSSKRTFNILFGATPGEIVGTTSVDEVESVPVAGALRLDFEASSYAVKLNDAIYYSEKHAEVYVPYDLTGVSTEEITAFVEFVAQYVRVEIIDEVVNVDSWIRTKNKEGLHSRIQSYFKRDLEESIKTKESDLRNHNSRLEDYRREFSSVAGRIKALMTEVEALRKGEVHGIDTFLEGLDLIANHPRVDNLIVKEDTVEAHVPNVIARVRIDRVDRFFYMGNMIIKIDIKKHKVTFDGTEKHKSYWSDRDVHPHISKNGNACLGNIEQTVLDLSQQLEVYPLFLICLDFIQSVNLDDTAGRNVYNWKEVQEDGSPIEKDKPKAKRPTAPTQEAVEATPSDVQVLMNVDGDFDNMLEEDAKNVATYVAYPQYIGYVHNENLESVEAFLAEGGEV